MERPKRSTKLTRKATERALNALLVESKVTRPAACARGTARGARSTRTTLPYAPTLFTEARSTAFGNRNGIGC